jgi:hypothetical protein
MITGPAGPPSELPATTRGFLDGRVVRLSGCGLRPWRPVDLFALELDEDEVDMAACDCVIL